MKKRLIWAAIGLGYAVLYGFWTMMATGGGHGNFIWFVLFLLGYVFGLTIPVMGFLLADLTPRWAKISGLLVSLIVTLLTVRQLLWLGDKGTQDIIESWNRSAFFFVVMSIIHLFPLFAFTAFVIRSFIRSDKAVSVRMP